LTGGQTKFPGFSKFRLKTAAENPLVGMTQERPLLSDLAEGWRKAGVLKQIIVAPAEGATLYVASSVHCQSLNQSWTSLAVSQEGNYQRTVDQGQGHMGTLQPGLRAQAQSAEEAVQFAGVPGFRRKVMFCSKISLLL